MNVFLPSLLYIHAITLRFARRSLPTHSATHTLSRHIDHIDPCAPLSLFRVTVTLFILYTFSSRSPPTYSDTSISPIVALIIHSSEYHTLFHPPCPHRHLSSHQQPAYCFCILHSPSSLLHSHSCADVFQPGVNVMPSVNNISHNRENMTTHASHII